MLTTKQTNNMKKIITLVALLATIISAGWCQYISPLNYTEAADPAVLSEAAVKAWDGVSTKLNGAWGDHDILYSRSEVPQGVTLEPCRVAGWRGERVSALALLWSAGDVKSVSCSLTPLVKIDDKSVVMPSAVAKTHFVRYTLSDKRDKGCLCRRQHSHPTALYPDMLDNLASMNLDAHTTRPVWISIAIPQEAAAGVYKAELVVKSKGGKVRLPLELEVVNQVLSKPSEWSYHLDLWQHPSAVARIRGLDMWSDAHFEALREEMKPLADAGQKVITATLNRDPWRYQCNDDYEPMIHWTKNVDGTWSYDYRIFDRWVELMISLGIDKQINCYSMLPWGDCRLDYWDAAKGKGAMVKAMPGTPQFEKMWAPFLVDFVKHLKAKGWINIANMAVDERAPEDMDEAARLISKYAPELGFALADNHDSYKRYANMRDVCVSIKHSKMTFDEIAARRAQGFVTTFYICCSTYFPNAFTYSEPYEAELLGWYGLACDYDGMLRWAYNSWPMRPEYDSRFRNFASGDTFFVYPYARSSMRFERMVDGIEVAEKVRTLRKKYAGRAELKPLETLLATFRGDDIKLRDASWQVRMAEANKLLLEVSKALAK